eukprot:Opistho-2@17629
MSPATRKSVRGRRLGIPHAPASVELVSRLCRLRASAPTTKWRPSMIACALAKSPTLLLRATLLHARGLPYPPESAALPVAEAHRLSQASSAMTPMARLLRQKTACLSQSPTPKQWTATRISACGCRPMTSLHAWACAARAPRQLRLCAPHPTTTREWLFRRSCARTKCPTPRSLATSMCPVCGLPVPTARAMRPAGGGSSLPPSTRARPPPVKTLTRNIATLTISPRKRPRALATPRPVCTNTASTVRAAVHAARAQRNALQRALSRMVRKRSTTHSATASASPSCPPSARARTAARGALATTGLPARWNATVDSRQTSLSAAMQTRRSLLTADASAPSPPT